ncbi:MAG TPA: hypothetical protein VFW31_09880 [Candidatus Angelobacter sp.]|nr:hypothetical protein [Candidatus Angelobacter sp.]
MVAWNRQKRAPPGHDSSHVVVTKYTIPVETAKEIKKAGPIYGSQGRALQVATEMLIRMEETPAPDLPKRTSPTLVRISMRLHRRTYELIQKLARSKYDDDPAQVIDACMKVLRMKKIKL